QAGGDFDPTPSSVALVDQIGFYSWGSTTEMVSDIQEWLDHPEAAHGWILLGDESLPTTVKRFDSRESPDQASWPLLYVEYTPPCAPDPKGPGYWDHQCSWLNGNDGIEGLERREGEATEPRFTEWIVPCANTMLGDLGFPEINACEALGSDSPRDCRSRALRKLSVLVLNVCAGRFQTSCSVEGEGDCRHASGCAGVLD
ncbi:MAG: hypothetical protein L0170_14465, partial [Acidobacteria bacterium]|nr:hypothetical protein [Acidobacteriota bacterium]